MENSTKNQTTMELADKYMFKTYGRFPITLIRGEGCKVWDEEGKEYLDFVGGLAVCAFGHSSPIVTKALEEQSKKLVHVSNLYYTRPQAEVAQILVENCFADRVFFCNSGAEANEAAIKLARRYANENWGPEKYRIISMSNSFHGRTMATLSATGQNKIQIGFDPLLSGFKFAQFNDLNSLKETVDESVCAVMLEPIQGEGGVVCPDQDYLKGVREFCDEKKILLIADEVQVGMGRTGKFFAHEHFGIEPDIMTMAKALANGLPMGAMLAKEELSSAFGPGSHATTFGGTPLVTAASKAVLKSLLEDGWISHCEKMGNYFKDKLQDLSKKHLLIKEVRGLGLILAIELDKPGAPVVDALMKEGFLINCTQDNVLRFLPPLIVVEKEIDMLIEALDKTFGQLN
jgi:acetylornithine aminotransferase